MPSILDFVAIDASILANLAPDTQHPGDQYERREDHCGQFDDADFVADAIQKFRCGVRTSRKPYNRLERGRRLASAILDHQRGRALRKERPRRSHDLSRWGFK